MRYGNVIYIHWVILKWKMCGSHVINTLNPHCEVHVYSGVQPTLPNTHLTPAESGTLCFCCPRKLSTLPVPPGIPLCMCRLLWFALSSSFRSVAPVVRWVHLSWVRYYTLWNYHSFCHIISIDHLLLSGQYVINQSKSCIFGTFHTTNCEFSPPAVFFALYIIAT